MRVGLVGCGYIGGRRAEVVRLSHGDTLVIAADVNRQRAEAVAQISDSMATGDWRDVVGRDDLDAVIVSTPNKLLAPITIAALERGLHVLCEKPMGRNLVEALAMANAAETSARLLKIGFNHRYYPGVRQAHELLTAGRIGPAFFVRCIYGHGGRPGYDKEWRGDPDLAGGGELLDQGVHVVDLCRWFLGDFKQAVAYTGTYYWDLGTHVDASTSAGNHQLEDNAFVLMRTTAGQIASVHTSWTQWKNTFVFEIYGRDGYLRVEGRGGSYGSQRLTLGERQPASGPPSETVWEFPDPDASWKAEWVDFGSAIRESRRPSGSVDDGLAAMRIIDVIYRSLHTGIAMEITA